MEKKMLHNCSEVLCVCLFRKVLILRLSYMQGSKSLTVNNEKKIVCRCGKLAPRETNNNASPLSY